MNRRTILKQLIILPAGTLISPLRSYVSADVIHWHRVQDWGVEGKGWSGTERFYDRLPVKAKNLVREPVWNLSRHAAGITASFSTNSKVIHIRYEVLNENLDMYHMPATGVSGVDLYAEDHLGRERWVQVTHPDKKIMEAELVKNLDGLKHKFTLYLPLYNGVESLDIGVPEGTTLTPITPRSEKPLVFYGTSILHGACASRPGMAFTNILRRRLNMPVINLGFSGNGRMEPELADLLSEIDARVYILDCVPNMSTEMVQERVVPFVQKLAYVRPQAKILLTEGRVFANAQFDPGLAEGHQRSREALNAAFITLKQNLKDNLFYLQCTDLIGDDGEGTTDGSHPNDLGMVRYADAYEATLREILGKY